MAFLQGAIPVCQASHCHRQHVSAAWLGPCRIDWRLPMEHEPTTQPGSPQATSEKWSSRCRI